VSLTSLRELEALTALFVLLAPHTEIMQDRLALHAPRLQQALLSLLAKYAVLRETYKPQTKQKPSKRTDKQRRRRKKKQDAVVRAPRACLIASFLVHCIIRYALPDRWRARARPLLAHELHLHAQLLLFSTSGACAR
jgi:hypothetical protein